MNMFINPYNFIPMEKKKSASQEGGERLSGSISYTVYTRTPLFIPNTSNDHYFAKAGDEPEHKSYDFYSYTNLEEVTDGSFHRPVIPGSEIRGMFRSNYEILTNSCMSALDSNSVLSKRTMESYQAGLIYRDPNTGKFSLYEADDAIWRTKGENSTADEVDWKRHYYQRKCYIQDKFPEGAKVNFRAERRAREKTLASEVSIYTRSSRGKEGYIIKGEEGPEIKDNPKAPIPSAQKHCCHIFSKKNRIVEESLSLNTLDIVLKEYQIQAKGANKDPYKEYRTELKKFRAGNGNEYFPVYYSRIEDRNTSILMLSPACKTREIYQNDLESLAGELAPCRDKNNLCAACALFGTLLGKDAVTSRLRFSDLQAKERSDNRDYYYGDSVTLPPLSSPKLNNMEFYLKKPDKNAWFWTYDYYVDKNGNVHIQRAQLAGRKFYWHNMIKKIPTEERGKLNMTIRPVAAGCSFEGKVYFKNLSALELDRLIYVINAGDPDPADKKKHGYKLGAAKPFGLGSIACAVTEVTTRKYVKADRTIMLEEKPYNYEGIYKDDKIASSDILKDYAKMTDFTVIPENEVVSYPKTKEDDEGFAWFVSNHQGYDRNKSKRTSMPRSRKDMVFLEHMEPMELKLRSVGIPGEYKKKQSYVPYENKKKQNYVPSEKIEYGIVVKIEYEKKYGFVSREVGKNLYFSAYDCFDFDKLKSGDKVSFILGKNKKGDCAIKVQKVQK